MDFDLHVRQSARHGRGFILARVVYQNDAIDDAVCHDFIISLAQSPGGVVSRHHDNNFLAVQHG